MAFMQISFYSKTLNMVTNMVAIIPEQTYGVGINSNVKKDMVEWPVLYLLHGGSDDSSKWWRYTSIERYVTEKKYCSDYAGSGAKRLCEYEIWTGLFFIYFRRST